MIKITDIQNFPHINSGDNLPSIIVDALKKAEIFPEEHDIFCVASKVVSFSENRFVNLNTVTPRELALKIHEQAPKKDPCTIQLIIDATGDPSGKRLNVSGNFIGGWLPCGLYLTSAGIDKIDSETVMLLPLNPDESAKKIGAKIFSEFGVNVGVVITDSDGRQDKAGATQIAVGVYGVSALRESYYGGKKMQETICDMLAAAGGLIMGQRGTGKPVVIIRGLEYEFNPDAKIGDAL